MQVRAPGEGHEIRDAQDLSETQNYRPNLRQHHHRLRTELFISKPNFVLFEIQTY